MLLKSPQPNLKLNARYLSMPNKASVLAPLISDKRKFTDIDEFSEAITGWELDFRQLENAKSGVSVEVLASPNVIVQHFHFPFAVHQCGLAPAGFTTIGLPFEESHLSWESKEGSTAVIVDFNNPDGFDAASGMGYRGITLSISDTLLSRNATLMRLKTDPIVPRDRIHLRSGGERQLDQLRNHLRYLCSLSLNTLNPQDSHLIFTELENEIPTQLLISLAELQPSLDNLPLLNRQKGLRLALQFINKNVHENPCIPDICEVSSLSWRSLDRVFKEHFGIGPKRYLLQLRLIRFRQQLKMSSPGTKISDIANIWGFWHMGDLAQKFRKFFGETPQDILKKHAKH